MYQEHDEYEEARRLLAPLASEPTRPSTVDIQRAMADGRRRLRTRRLAGMGAVAAVTALVVAGVPAALAAVRAPDGPPVASGQPSPTGSPSPTPTGPPPPTECEMAALAEPDGAYQSFVTAADPTGRFVAGRLYFPAGNGEGNLVPGTRVQTVIWDGGDPVTVDVPGFDALATDIDSAGVAVGTSFDSYDDTESMFAWIYQDGQVSRLAGENVSVAAINEQGVAVGTQGDPEQPVVWRSPTADPEELPLPAGDWVVGATAVDTDGTIVGSGYDSADIPDPPDHSFVWQPDGTRREIPLPTINGEPAFGFRADSIHDGVVTGEAIEGIDGGWQFHVFRYDRATGEFTELDPGVPMGVQAWSAGGWFVGHTRDELVMVAGSEVVPLPYPQTPEDPLDISLNNPTVAAVSDDGRMVAGEIRDEEGHAHATAWHCR